jgi:hypothetical protein
VIEHTNTSERPFSQALSGPYVVHSPENNCNDLPVLIETLAQSPRSAVFAKLNDPFAPFVASGALNQSTMGDEVAL